MTTGRINQVDIVPPSEEQPRRIALTQVVLNVALTQAEVDNRTYSRRYSHIALTQAASTNRTYTPGDGLTNSFATEC